MALGCNVLLSVREKRKRAPWAAYERAYTLIDLLVGLSLLLVVTVVLLPMFSRRPHSCAPRIFCVNNLKQIGLSFRQWALDHQDRFPMEVSVTNGGTMEFVNTGIVWAHFTVMSNELNTPKVLLCPADKRRADRQANTFGAAQYANQIPFTNDNSTSYFVGVDAVQTNGQMLLSGDRNITNTSKANRRLVSFSTNQLAGWTDDLHRRQGNVGLADGSVQQFTASRLRDQIAHTGVVTNRLAMP